MARSNRGITRATGGLAIDVETEYGDDEDDKKILDLLAKNTDFKLVSDNLFSCYDFSVASDGDLCTLDTKDSPDSAPCFNDNPNCGHLVINGFCNKCLEALLKLKVCNSYQIYAGQSHRQCFPFSLIQINEPKQIFPLLSLLGEVQESELESLKSTENQDAYTNIVQLITQLSLPRESVKRIPNTLNKYLTLALHYQKMHAQAIKLIANDLDSTVVNLYFTNGFKPKNKLSLMLFKSAKPVDKNEGIKHTRCRVSMFKNIIDMYLLRLFAPSNFQLRNQNLAYIPTVQILDGWFYYGLGTGNEQKPTKSADASYKQYVVKTPKFEAYVGKDNYHQLKPLTLDLINLKGAYVNKIVALSNAASKVLAVPLSEDFTMHDSTGYTTIK